MPETGETDQGQDLPKIIIAEEILSPDSPYALSVDPEGAAEILRIAGVKSEDIPKVTIRFKRKPPFLSKTLGETRGDYSKRTLTIYTDQFWKWQQKITSRYQEINRKSHSSLETPEEENLFPLLKSGKRLTWYIGQVDEQRANETIQNLSRIATNRELNSTLAHEASHASDDFAGNLTRTKQIRPKDLLKKFGLAQLVVQGANIAISNFHVLPEGEGLQTPVIAGLATSASAWALISYMQSGSRENPTEVKAYDFQAKQDGVHKILAIDPRS